MRKEFTIDGELCYVKKDTYAYGGIALQVITVVENEPYLTATVWIPTELAPDEVTIKNYSENEGILDILFDAGIISAPVRSIDRGYVDFPVCKLLAVGDEIC